MAHLLKRTLDIAAALVGLIILSPLLATLCLLHPASPMGPPVFFRQRRPGLAGNPFTLVKFRTMPRHSGGMGSPSPTPSV